MVIWLHITIYLMAVTVGIPDLTITGLYGFFSKKNISRKIDPWSFQWIITQKAHRVPSQQHRPPLLLTSHSVRLMHASLTLDLAACFLQVLKQSPTDSSLFPLLFFPFHLLLRSVFPPPRTLSPQQFSSTSRHLLLHQQPGLRAGSAQHTAGPDGCHHWPVLAKASVQRVRAHHHYLLTCFWNQ